MLKKHLDECHEQWGVAPVTLFRDPCHGGFTDLFISLYISMANVFCFQYRISGMRSITLQGLDAGMLCLRCET